MNDMRIVPSSIRGYCSKVKYVINYLVAHYLEEVIVNTEKLERQLPISFKTRSLFGAIMTDTSLLKSESKTSKKVSSSFEQQRGLAIVQQRGLL